jgi:hypothetical protein
VIIPRRRAWFQEGMMVREDMPAKVPQNTALEILLLLVRMVHKRAMEDEAMTLEIPFVCCWICHVKYVEAMVRAIRVSDH